MKVNPEHTETKQCFSFLYVWQSVTKSDKYRISRNMLDTSQTTSVIDLADHASLDNFRHAEVKGFEVTIHS